MGRAAETEAHINEAFRLSPRDMLAHHWLMLLGFAKLLLTADAEAVNWFHRSIEANRNYPIAHFGLATALALLGSLDEARAAARASASYQGMRMAWVPEGWRVKSGDRSSSDDAVPCFSSDGKRGPELSLRELFEMCPHSETSRL